MTEFNVGDKVRVLYNHPDGTDAVKGDTGTVLRALEGGVDVEFIKHVWWLHCDSVEPVEDEQEADPLSVANLPHPSTPHCPSHYKQGDIECIDAIYEALGVNGFIDYCRGSAMKYLWRCEDKGDKDSDLKKAERFTQWASSKGLYSTGVKPSEVPQGGALCIKG